MANGNPTTGILAPLGSAERWAQDYVSTRCLAHKLSPPPVPDAWSEAPLPSLRSIRPGRPDELTVSWHKYKAPKSVAALRAPEKRAGLLHTFFHHELQAAELMCWAVLAFPDAPRAFRRGLLGICLDEVRHMGWYKAHLERLGFPLGSFPVRDWFWQRAPDAKTPAEFVALMGIGFEGGNLDHAERFAQMLSEAGDGPAAALQKKVGDEEVAHVAFGVHWFQRFTGSCDFAQWQHSLPKPLSPMVMRGLPLAREQRLKAGMSPAFIEELAQWQPALPGS